MKLGEFDEARAKNEAISFLSKSIYTLASILGIDLATFDPSVENPHEPNSPFYASYDVLRQESIALRNLTEAAVEQS